MNLLAGGFIARLRQLQRFPVLIADANGMRFSNGRYNRVVLHWLDIEAWMIVPAKPGSATGDTYVVFTQTHYLYWKEPADAQLAGRKVRGDRVVAFRERAREMHELIAAQTGLPLREYHAEQ